MGHPTTVKTCGVALLLLAVLQFFVVLDINAPVWAKVIAVLLLLAVLLSPMNIIGGDEAKMSLGKILCYVCGISGIAFIVFLFFSPPPEATEDTQKNFELIRWLVPHLLIAGLSVFGILVAIVSKSLGKKSALSVTLFLITDITICILYFIPSPSPAFIAIPYAVGGAGYLLLEV
jgi:hypothetical protein